MQHQCTAALVRARCKPHCSVMLCKTGSQQAVWHCIYTYEDLLLIQVCSDALQNRLTAGSVALHLHLWRSALHTGVQGCNTNALQHLSGQNAFPTVQCCSAKQAHSRQCGTAFTPMDTWCSYNCSGTQHQCTAALFKAKCNPYCSVLLCKTGPQQALSLCIYTYGDLLLIQVCSDPAPLHCSTAARAKCTPHCSVVLCKRGPQQALSKCIYTYGDLLLIQVCSDATPMHCSKGKMQSLLFSAALQNRPTAGTESLHLHLWRSALDTGVQ